MSIANATLIQNQNQNSLGDIAASIDRRVRVEDRTLIFRLVGVECADDTNAFTTADRLAGLLRRGGLATAWVFGGTGLKNDGELTIGAGSVDVVFMLVSPKVI